MPVKRNRHHASGLRDSGASIRCLQEARSLSQIAEAGQSGLRGHLLFTPAHTIASTSFGSDNTPPFHFRLGICRVGWSVSHFAEVFPMRKRLLVPVFAVAAVIALVPASSPAQPKDDDAWKTAVDKATAYLKKSQNEDGSWSASPQNRGITGIAVVGLIRTDTKPDDAPAAKGVKFIESLVNAKSGHIAGDDSKATLINYTTSINIMALNAANKGDKYKAVIGNAAKYLKEYQWDESRGKKQDSDYYGGAGYAGDKSRPDLSNTAFFLEALKEAGVDKNDPAFTKALVFVGRCQNLKSEYNTAAWAEKNNDGSFAYTGANGGENRRSDDTTGDMA